MLEFVLQMVLLPVHATLAWLYWIVRVEAPRRPWLDSLVILAALGAWLATALWGYRDPPADAGRIWPHVLATFAGFLAYSAVLALAWMLRTLAGRKAHSSGPKSSS